MLSIKNSAAHSQSHQKRQNKKENLFSKIKKNLLLPRFTIERNHRRASKKNEAIKKKLRMKRHTKKRTFIAHDDDVNGDIQKVPLS